MANRASTLIRSLFILTLLSALLLSVSATPGHARMVRAVRRQNGGVASVDPFTIQNIGADPTDTAATATKTAKGGKQTDTLTGTNTLATPTGNPAGQETTTDGGLLGGLTSLLPLPGQNTSTVDTSTTSTSTSSSTTTSASSTTQTTTSSPPPLPSTQTVNAETTITSTAPQTSSTTDAQANVNNSTGATSNGGGHIARNTIISIAAVGGSIGLAILLWTVFRKWKLRPTDGFEERLNPIDWNPTSTEPDMVQRDRERRRASVGSNRSFQSADAHSMRTNNLAGGGYMNDIPNHDFTAGPQVPPSLAPGMYQDLRRGPSRGAGGYGATAYGGY